ncbi:DUF4179 domain-containing protein [Ruminococcus sp. OA3]|uniref:DUF4179 domain-containing protein n=1 Tax=Ruminococcus sp. OA3 TaxID=2914164 RepID=UPI001F06D037|nr:DUF4179 domain-containing protein [Ruminococcus sp. OA3]MCH1984339.1 DUF4179 domain-containing protein [Ruminococcus sp. OA3]
MKYSEETMKRVLGQEPAQSAVIDRSMEEAYQKIRSAKTGYKKRSFRKMLTGITGTAAVAAVACAVFVSNPVLAEKIPLIGRIFQTVEEDVTYKGDYSSHAQSLVTEGNEEDSQYVQTSNGITVTVSEAYYDSMALYLAVSIENEEGFPDDFIRTQNMEGYQLDYDRLELTTSVGFDFSEAGLGVVECTTENGMITPYYIEGQFEDNQTFAGIIRMDLEYLADGAGGYIEVPDQFGYTLRISDIFSDLSTASTTQTVNDPDNPGETLTIPVTDQKHYEGEWEFNFDVVLDNSSTTTVTVDETNEAGVGISAVTRTAYEIKADAIIPEGASPADYIVAICDADGELLESQGDIVEVYSTHGRDTSKVSVYVVDYITYMDECKGDNAYLLPEKALYQTEIEFS